MRRDRAIINKLKRHEAELRRLGIERLYLFGSIEASALQVF
jgi:predicted nucleotidyltransferase